VTEIPCPVAPDDKARRSRSPHNKPTAPGCWSAAGPGDRPASPGLAATGPSRVPSDNKPFAAPSNGR